MKITEKHLELNPSLKDVYKVGDEIKTSGSKTETPCNKNSPTDPHHGEAGHYDDNCNWIPSV